MQRGRVRSAALFKRVDGGRGLQVGVGIKSRMLLKSEIYCMGMGFGLLFKSFSECIVWFVDCREVGAGRGCAARIWRTVVCFGVVSVCFGRSGAGGGCCVRMAGLGCCLKILGVWVVSEAGQAGAGPQCVRFRPKSVELA